MIRIRPAAMQTSGGAAVDGSDSSAASAALHKLKPRLSALSGEQIAAPRADVKLAAMAALAVADRLAAPEVRARFTRLPREELDPAHLDDLRDAAWAAWHAKSQLDAALAAQSEPPLPGELVERAGVLKERMLRVLKYWLEDDAAVQKQLSPLARRKGTAELAADLSRLAALYREKRETIAADVKHHRAEDADDADKLAAEARALSGARREQAEKSGGELVSRAFALLLQIYDEVRAAGLYLYRRDANAAELFPALNTLSATRARKKQPEAPPAAQG